MIFDWIQPIYLDVWTMLFRPWKVPRKLLITSSVECDILTLQPWLKRERERRQSDINTSFNELHNIPEKNDVVLKINSVITYKLIVCSSTINK